MGKIEDLEKRIEVLEEESKELARLKDIEAIKKLKAKYWRCVDRRIWDELEEVFTENAQIDYGPAGSFDGKKAVMEYFRQRSNSARKSLIGIHHGYHPEIEITGANTAKGTWLLVLYRIDSESHRGMRIGGSYFDEYVKENGKWKVKSSRDAHEFKEEWSEQDLLITIYD